MEPVPFFKETQRIRNFWFWLPVGMIDALLAYACITQLMFGRAFGSRPASNPALVVIACLVILLTVGFSSVSLETEIGVNGIRIRFLPFFWSWKEYSWEKVSAAYISEYRPLHDFGGWGIRWGEKGTAYTISGKFGIQLVFTHGSKLLVGTSRAREAEAVLERVGRLRKETGEPGY